MEAAFNIDALFTEKGKLNHEMLQILTGTVFSEHIQDGVIDPNYIEEMVEFYTVIFVGYVVDLTKKWREYNLTDLHLFKSIIEVFRPVQF